MTATRIAVLFIIGLTMVLGAVVTDDYVTARSHNPTQATVVTFNDGFTTAKQDDCQQGYRPACQWLRETR